jgi:chemotaxis protein MotB
MNRIIVIAFCIFLTSSCVSKKKFVELQDEYANFKTTSRNSLNKAKNDLKERDKLLSTSEANAKVREKDILAKTKHIKNLEEQTEFLKKTNNKLLEKMTDLTVMTKAGAESIKKSMEALNEQNQLIESINIALQRKDSLNLNFMVSLKRIMNDIPEEDLNMKVRKGLVCITISDRILYAINNTALSQKGENTIERLAKVLNEYHDLDILVENHTDNTLVSADAIKDNWDMSAKRASAVVRILQTRFNVSPDRMIAGGRSEYSPKEYTGTEPNKKVNRRTEIYVMPQLDQFFQAFVLGSKLGN